MQNTTKLAILKHSSGECIIKRPEIGPFISSFFIAIFPLGEFEWSPSTHLLPSPSGMATTHTAEMASKLYAAEPTMVLGPSGSDSKPLPITPITARHISGAEEPECISHYLSTSIGSVSSFSFSIQY